MFALRSTTKELLDAENIPRQDLYRNLSELNVINSLLGGHAVTIKGIKQLDLDTAKHYRILDIGSGGGDTLKAIAAWGRKNGYSFELTGADLKGDCIEYAQDFCKDFPEIGFIKDDYRNLQTSDMKYDVIITSLFCHHLTDEELMQLFTWCSSNAGAGFIMNDLHRHPLAYYSISFLTRFFSRSYLVRNDAKLSVRRGFKRKELEELVTRSVHKSFYVKWVWAFRWLLVIKNERHIG